MKKRNIAIALAVIAIAGAAEYRIFISKPSAPKEIPVSISEINPQDGISGETRIVTAGNGDFEKNAVVVSGNTGEISYQYDGIKASDTDYRKVAAQMLENLDSIEKINQCSVKCDRNISETVDSTAYYRFLDRNFSSVKDVDSYLSMNLTDKLITSRYSEITGGPSPVLRDINGAVYARQNKDPGNGFEWETDESGNIVLYVSETSQDGFTINSSGYTIEFVSENCLWKIDSVK